MAKKKKKNSNNRKKPAKAQKKNLRANIALLIIFIIIAVAIAELAVRLVAPQSNRFYDYDALIGYKPIPNHTVVNVKPEFTLKMQDNAQGWRDVDHKIEKPKGTYRIVIIGDSYVEAREVDLNKTFFRLLEDKLNKQGFSKNIEVISLGVGGFGTAQEYLLLKYYALAYDPDLVILAFFNQNDVYDNGMSAKLRNIKYFELKNNTLSGPYCNCKPYTPLEKFLGDYSQLARFINYVTLSRKTGTPEQKMLHYWIYAKNYTQGWEDAWIMTKYLLRIFKDSAEQEGAHVMIMIIPGPAEISDEKWEQAKAERPLLNDEDFDRDKPRQIMLAFCQEKSMDCLDLKPAFLSYTDTQNPLYYSQNIHWTEAGHELTAELLAKKIIEEKIIT